MNLYTDNNPKTTLNGLGFKDKKVALETINIVEKYFNKLNKKQKINSWTPKNTLPKKYITSKEDKNNYYNNQKKFRILGMRNRAKGMIKRVNNNKNLLEAIKVFDKWLKKN